MWANEVPIVGWTLVDNGVIFAVGDYLFDGTRTESSFPRIYKTDEEEKSTTTATTTTATTTTTESTTTYEPSPKEHWIRVEKCESERPESSDLFRNIVVCTEEWVDPKSPGGRTAIKLRKQVRKEDQEAGIEEDSGTDSVEVAVRKGEGEGEENLPGFLQDIVDVLSVLRFGSNDFLQYIQDVDIKAAFNDGAYLQLYIY